MTPIMRDTVLKPFHIQWNNWKLVTSETYKPHWWITDQRETNKKLYDYLNKLTHASSGSINICKRLNKICDGRKTSAENKRVSTIYYQIVPIKYNCSTFNDSTIYQSHQNINCTQNMLWYMPHLCHDDIKN